MQREGDDVRLRALAALGEVGSSREARKESRSLGIFKGVSKASEVSTTTPPPVITTPDDSKKPALASTVEPTKPEKTIKTTATYYPKMSRQERKDSITVIEEAAPITPAPTREPVLSSALTSLGYESESGDELGSAGPELESISLKPYKHQVGGHSALFRFSRHAVCKPLIGKENAFYQEVEINRRECNFPALPQMVGSITVLLVNVANDSTSIYATVHRHVKCHTSRLFLVHGRFSPEPSVPNV